MSRLLTANLIAILQHTFEDVAVADLCDFGTAARFLYGLVKANVCHNRRDDCIIGKRSLLHHIRRTHDEDVITVDNLSFFIDAKAAVSIAVMCDTKVRGIFNNRLLQRFHMRRTTAVIDIRTVRKRMDDLNICAQLPKHLWHNFICRAVRTV